MAEVKKKTCVFHFRTNEEDGAEIKKKLKAAKMSVSEFLRDVFLNSKVIFNVKEAKPFDYHKLLFVYNKSSNNINQLAHRINHAHRVGIINEELYRKLINPLVNIESLLRAGLDNANTSERL
ncbi:molybdopterin-guanine dinucleotide biosynthesis protein MobC (plasmid) [Pseudomonas sp. BF61]|uniref:plasmid mobilization protein n=1 Tax=Pseudomonas sp. BF61 TaxID=2741068 RepID=UPI001C0DD514|nr:molybdopterin-guanine dinucleotide biosynthesis protein MobC [Pseudomonas sp. BF61]MBU4630939.1 molybdopterin-guanine dinucleotide biosynthesis protein MobC [Pseudomonas sp. BF61]